MTPPPRIATITRKTVETEITVTLTLDGSGRCTCRTDLGFLDHMINTLARHARIDIDLTCRGDLAVDDHHTVEDCALVLGAAIDQALSERRGIERFGSAYAPLDEALARCVIDLSGRPLAVVNLQLERDMIGTVSCENIAHFFRSLATASRSTLHVDVVRGENDHHKAEAAFKSLALALRMAVACSAPTDPTTTVPSTKGVLV